MLRGEVLHVDAPAVIAQHLGERIEERGLAIPPAAVGEKDSFVVYRSNQRHARRLLEKALDLRVAARNRVKKRLPHLRAVCAGARLRDLAAKRLPPVLV